MSWSRVPNGVAVVNISLVKAHHRQNLRPEDADDPGMPVQRLPGALSAQELCHLRLNPLRSDVSQQLPVPLHGGARFILSLQPQHGGEAHPPHNPQCILLKPPVRVPHTPQNSVLQIPPPAQGVPQFPPKAQRHGVDSEIPPRQILLQRAGKGHLLRMPTVPVLPVQAVGRHLHRPPRRLYSNGAVAQPRGQSPVSKQRHHLLRQGGGGHIPVLRRPNGGAGAVQDPQVRQQRIPHTAAHAPRLISSRLQPLQKPPHALRNRQHPVHRLFLLHFP